MNPNQSRIEEALEKALQKPDEEREAYLSEVCGEDVDLRRELESLINAGLVADQFMAEAETFPMNDPSEDVGSFIGPYRLLQKIGEGGFGNVYISKRRGRRWR